MTDIETCQRFALAHKLIFEDDGEVGFGRPCVGFIARSGCYVDYDPLDRKTYDPIEDLTCEAARPGPDVIDAYHKHHCLAVLGSGDAAIAQLAAWVHQMDAAGTVRIVEYETGAVGMQAIATGATGYAVVIDDKGATS